jgi:hypothetical protein
MEWVHSLTRQRRLIVGRLFMVMACLLVVNIVLQVIRYRTGHDYLLGLLRLFDVNEEANIPTLFSTLLLLSAGLLLAVIASGERARGGRDVGRWKLLSAVFLFLAVDESAMLHELFITPGHELLGRDVPGVIFYAWVIPYFLLVLGLMVYLGGFVLRLPTAIRTQFILSAVLFVGGSLGVELFEGIQDKWHGEHTPIYALLASIEEGMEMAGVIVFIGALLHYIDVSSLVPARHRVDAP